MLYWTLGSVSHLTRVKRTLQPLVHIILNFAMFSYDIDFGSGYWKNVLVTLLDSKSMTYFISDLAAWFPSTARNVERWHWQGYHIPSTNYKELALSTPAGKQVPPHTSFIHWIDSLLIYHVGSCHLLTSPRHVICTSRPYFPRTRPNRCL